MNLFFVCGWSTNSKKKWRETVSLLVEHNASFRHFFFFRMDTPSTNKRNEFTPYHLIISKQILWNIMELYIFYDLFMHCIYCDSEYLWCLSIASQIDGYKIHPIFQPIEKLVTWKIKWFKNIANTVYELFSDMLIILNWIIH
jgi:hypothetical protein